jgi:hypothetical protein
MEPHLVRRLVDSAVSAIVASGDGKNAIGWFDRPTDEEMSGGGFPAVVLNQIAAGDDYTHDGDDGLPSARVQFDLLALASAELWALRRALKTEMERDRVVTLAGEGSVRFHFGFRVSSQTAPIEIMGERRVLRAVDEYQFFWETV